MPTYQGDMVCVHHHHCITITHLTITFSSSNPICSVKKILYKSDGPFIWDKVNHLFALKRVSSCFVQDSYICCIYERVCMCTCIKKIKYSFNYKDISIET